jgi:hypothetical protein
MKHLTPDQLLDVAEGTRARDEFAHLAACAGCERQVAELRETMGVAAEVEVPEPSPLFWEHLSANVRERVAEEPAQPAWWWGVPQFGLAAAAVAIVVLAAGSVFRQGGAPAAPGEPPMAVVEAPLADAVSFDDDPALALLADLSAGIDWEAASEAGLTPAPGTADRVVMALTVDERLELQRILEEALAAAGA